MNSNDKKDYSARNRKIQRLLSYLQLNYSANYFGDDDENYRNSTFMPKRSSPRSHAHDEEIFGVLLLICGLAAAVANALILIIAVKHLRSRNVLFIIITNFALIDEFKALCAIYMGAAQLFSVAFMKMDQASVYKMLQISVFIFYFGNICSVLNLVLAVTNEFLYIKLPLQYSKFVKKRRVVCAVICIWLAGVAFSLSKALHSGSNETGAQIWISSSMTINVTVVDESSTDTFNRTLNALNSNTNPSKVIRRPNNVVADVYALILVSVLLFCLFVVGAIYLNLYITIRRATCFRVDSGKSRRSNESSMKRRRSADNPVDVDGEICINSSFKRKTKLKLTKRFITRQSSENFNNHNQHHKQNLEQCGVEQPMLSGRSTTFTVPSHCKHRRRDSRLFKRHKCVIVILSVCCLYLIYLSCYFALQLFHIIHIVKGIDQNKLRERYIINFILRALFVLHASLNPLIFFRIQTFRLSFINFCPCSKVGQTPRGGHSFVELTLPIVDP